MYVPILHWKRGEQSALKLTRRNIKDQVRPLVQFIPVPRDPNTGAPKKTFGDHVTDQVTALNSCWGPHLVFLDAVALANEDAAQQQPGWLRSLFDTAAQLGVLFVPVLGLGAPADDFAAAAAHAERGLCLRLSLVDLEAPDFQARVDAALSSLSATPGVVDVILDLGSVAEQARISVVATATLFLTSLPHVQSWRSVTIAATAFPRIAAVPKGSSVLIERTEWHAWRSLSTKNLPRFPTFGDYCIQHPELPDMDPRLINPAAKVRYTLDSDWLVLGGSSIRKHGGGQFEDLARSLSQQKGFMGAAHCRGCEAIVGCSEGEVRAGNLEAWRKLGTAHHIAVTFEQLSSTRAA